MPTRRMRSLWPLVAFAATTAAIPGQVQWQRFEYLPLNGGPLVFDAARDRFVQLNPPNGTGSPETWEWDRVAGWQHRSPSNSPPWRAGGAMAFDPVRGVTVRFSGFGFSSFVFRETYTWDGVTWTNVSPATQPSVREGHAMAYDAARGRVVMFGGHNPDPNGSDYGDTWEWNGAQWSQLPVAGPAPRRGHGLVYDQANANIVLFGGASGASALGDTWTLAAATWTQRGAGPTARTKHAMAYDTGRSRVVMFGGDPIVSSILDDTWEWDGFAWSQQNVPVHPDPRVGAGLAGDPVGGGVVLVGGSDLTTGFADTWRWDGRAWTLLAGGRQPTSRHSFAAAFDDTHGEMVMFGGVGNTILSDGWRWNGALWSTMPAGPTGRMRAAMAHDTLRGETVMFGGDSQVGFTNETWTWNGTAWSQRLPPTSPTPRSTHAMAYDRARARIVLFGGFQNVFNNYYLGDTWEWDGSSWLQRATTGPLPRLGHGMAYDSTRGVTVLYGGVGAGQPFGTAFTDTWEWNGTNWTRRFPATDPGPRREFGMAFDDLRERVVVFGDLHDAGTWEWDGSHWALRAVTATPPARERSKIVFDTRRQRTLLFGGSSSGPDLADLWQYGPVAPAAATAFGAGCSSTPGMSQITALSRPWLGSTVPVVLDTGSNGAVTAFWIGWSRTAYGGLALPFALTALGMPNCYLHTSIDTFVLTTANTVGRATIPFMVPNLAALLGLEVHWQGALLDANANAAGIAMSGGLTLQLGGR